jgi:hypothetical protein
MRTMSGRPEHGAPWLVPACRSAWGRLARTTGRFARHEDEEQV